MSARRARLTRTHSVGAHTLDLVALRVGKQLSDLRAEKGGRLDPEDYKPHMQLTGRSRRQLQRYATAYERQQAVRLLTTGAGDESASAVAAARRAAAGKRYRYEVDEHDQLVIAAAPSRYEAWMFLRVKDQQSNVFKHRVGKSAFYEAFARLPKSVQAGLLKGSTAMKAYEPHLPRVFTQLGQSVSYDLKHLRINVVVDEATGLLSDDNWLLAFRDELSDVVMGRLVLDHSPTDAEVAALLAETVRGWTFDDVFVGGAPDLLHPDNEAKLNGPKMRQAQSLLGTLISSSESFESEANGGQERVHLDIDRWLSPYPGRTRGPRRRGGKTYVADTAVEYLTFEQLRDAVYDRIDEHNFDERPSHPRFAGRTRFEFFRDQLADGKSALRQVDDELLAPLGLPLPRRKLDDNAGTLRWDNGFYFSDKLASRGDTHYVATGLPNDPTVVFLFDDSGRYVDAALRIEEVADRARARSVVDRKAREKGVDGIVAEAERRLRAGSWADAFADFTGDASETDGSAAVGAATQESTGDVGPAPVTPRPRRSGPTAPNAGRKPAGLADAPDPLDSTDQPDATGDADDAVRVSGDLDATTAAVLRRNGVA